MKIVLLTISICLAMLGKATAIDKTKDYCEPDFCIQTVRRGTIVSFFAHNKAEFAKTSVRLKLELSHMTSDMSSPVLAVVEPGERRLLTWVESGQTGDPTYKFWYWYRPGDYRGRHDKLAIYFLPIATGAIAQISQGCNERFSHNGKRQYATDIDLAVGTPIHAARGGTVIVVREDSDRGGPTKEFEHDSNYIFIEHSDGTIAAYFHLMKDGADVEEGQIVEAKQAIGRSGNTGWSTAPHLHFEVLVPDQYMDWQSQKVTFLTGIGPVTCPAYININAL